MMADRGFASVGEFLSAILSLVENLRNVVIIDLRQLASPVVYQENDRVQAITSSLPGEFLIVLPRS